jgi:RNase P subunit RPR2
MTHLTPLHCRRCDALLGRCSDDRLVVGGVRIIERVRVTCIACGESYLWRPVVRCAVQVMEVTR